MYPPVEINTLAKLSDFLLILFALQYQKRLNRKKSMNLKTTQTLKTA